MSRTHHHRRRPRPNVFRGPVSRAVRVEWSMLDDYSDAVEKEVERLVEEAKRQGVASSGQKETYCVWLAGAPCPAFKRVVKALGALLGPLRRPG